MPPANTPVEASTPADPQDATDSPVSFSAMINELASPVPDLASTLNYQAADEVDSDNVDFLRNYALHFNEATDQARAQTNLVDNPEAATDHVHPSLTSRPDLYPTSRDQRLPHQLSRSEWRRVRLARHVATSSLQAVTATEPQSEDLPLEDSNTASMQSLPSPYGERVPNQQSLYDWAPLTEEAGEHELEYILSELRRSQPNTHPDVLRSLARTTIDAARDGRSRHSLQRTASSQQDSSLRPAAILQSIRRHWRISQQTRMLMNMLDVERERASQNPSTSQWPDSSAEPPQTPELDTSTESQTVADSTTPEPPPPPTDTTPPQPPDPAPASNAPLNPEPPRTLIATSDDIQLPAPSSSSTLHSEPTPNPSSVSEQPQPPTPMSNVSATNEPAQSNNDTPSRFEDDNLTDFTDVIKLWCKIASSSQTLKWKHNLEGIGPTTLDLLKPPPTSWLVPGVTFTGEQHAVPLATTPLVSNGTSTATNSTRGSSRSSTYSRSAALYLVHPSPQRRLPSLPSRWPVKLAVHAVDYDTMILQGTMEAFNNPPMPTPPLSPNPTGRTPAPEPSAQKTTFSTYVEGEIIDFAIHPLQTEAGNFGVKTAPTVDANYWRRLEPFASLRGSQLAEALRDPQWIQENLTKKYILMRWKERSFVKPTLTSFSQINFSNTSQTEHQQRPPQSSTSTATFLSSSDRDGYGLSISGYYYISMRRSDGRCEGLYYDPASAPFQRLELSPTVGTWGCGTWEFR